MPTIKLGCNCPMIQARSPAFIRCFYLLINVCLTVMLLPTLSFCLGPAVASASIGTNTIPSSLKINLWTSLEWPMPRDLTIVKAVLQSGVRWQTAPHEQPRPFPQTLGQCWLQVCEYPTGVAQAHPWSDIPFIPPTPVQLRASQSTNY